MSTKTTLIIVTLLAIALMVTGTALSGRMGSVMATHWNERGEADGYGSSFTGIYLLPLIMLGTSFLVVGMTYIDPLRKNVDIFRPQVNAFVLVVALFLAYLYGLTLFWNLGLTFNMNRMMAPGMGLLIYYAGVLMSTAKRNWFVGIRTPWTLMNDQVWDDTHRIGGLLFKISGAIALLGVLFPNATIFFLLIPVLAASLYAVVYSYIDFQRIARKSE